MALPVTTRSYDPSHYVVREGQIPQRCVFVIDGFAFRQKLTASGQRQIVSLHIPGDLVDVQNLFLRESDHDMQALTPLTVAEIPIPPLREVALTNPAIGKAMWIDALIEASIGREWLLNVGRRSARTRLAHLLCEFAARLRAAGLGREDDKYELPMTQEQLGDALGLTSVHVNRVLQGLQREGLIERDRREVGVRDWRALREAAEFNDRYLHFNQGGD